MQHDNRQLAKHLVLAVIFLIVAVWLNYISTLYVDSLPKQEPVLDLMHSIFTFNQAYSIISEIFLVLAVLVFLWYIASRKDFESLPFYLTCIATFYLVRALILPLTPLQDPYPADHLFGILSWLLPNGGTFPSGHTGLVFMMLWLVKSEDKAYKYIMLALSILMAFFMIISRGHYTIDVIGSIFITYTIYHVADRIRNSSKENAN